MTIGEVIRRTTEHLESRALTTPRLDAELLLGKALGLERIELYMHHDRPLAEDELDRARELVARRARREPLQYILGEWGFRRLTLTVDSRALIPRPETETLVERALDGDRRTPCAAGARRRNRVRGDRARDRRRAPWRRPSRESTSRRRRSRWRRRTPSARGSR